MGREGATSNIEAWVICAPLLSLEFRYGRLREEEERPR